MGYIRERWPFCRGILKRGCNGDGKSFLFSNRKSFDESYRNCEMLENEAKMAKNVLENYAFWSLRIGKF
jgi:hypothetical protein